MKEINPIEYSKEILQGVEKGVLLTTKVRDELNTMTISWGMMGIQWNKPIFIAFVREGRHTRSLLDQSEEFTINIPFGEFEKKILAHCGTNSGRNNNKFAELGLEPTKPLNISTPGIKQLPLTLECKIIYTQLQNPAILSNELKDRFYPQDKPSEFCGSNKDVHIVYYGEIVGAYIA